MNIKNAEYMKDFITKENLSIKATIDGTEMFVPLDPDNLDYAEILRQIKEEGLTIKDAD